MRDWERKRVGAGDELGGDRAGGMAAGKRTLTEGLVQFKQPGPGGGGGAPPPPQQTPKDMVAFVVHVDGQYVQVYVSPGGIDNAPDVFMFFHGHRANLQIDPDMPAAKDDNVSGNDTAAAAVRQGRAKNTIALLPQGVRGEGDAGGRMKALQRKEGLEKFIDGILADVAVKLAMKGAITPKHVSLAGHSAGGYQGVHDALVNAGKYADTISDLTLMDTNYSTSHFKDALAWVFMKSPNKTIRIVQSADQILNSYQRVPDPDDAAKKIKKRVDPYWRSYFGETALAAAAKKHGMKVNQILKYDLKSTEDRGNHTRVLQHTQIINADNKVQCDVLVMQSDLGHHEIRDNVMDDAINSIGKGDGGAAAFGKNQMADYGRDPNAPHHGNVERVPGEPEPPKPKPKPK